MDIISLIMFRVQSLITRIKEIYSYIFKFFLPGIPDDDTDDGIGGIFRPNSDQIHL